MLLSSSCVIDKLICIWYKKRMNKLKTALEEAALEILTEPGACENAEMAMWDLKLGRAPSRTKPEAVKKLKKKLTKICREFTPKLQPDFIDVILSDMGLG